jgi:hypothetical protein
MCKAHFTFSLSFAFPFIDSTFSFCPSYLISRKKNAGDELRRPVLSLNLGVDTTLENE